ncbi:MAG: ATP-binding protein [Candidatus Promineifilaceae bacterium]
MSKALLAVVHSFNSAESIQLICANNIKTAKQLCENQPIDLVFISRNDFDSDESLPLLQSTVATIIVGSQSDAQYLQEFMLSGACEFVTGCELMAADRLAFIIQKNYLRRVKVISHVRALSKRNEHLQQLNQASQLLASTLDPQQVLTQMLMEVTAITGAKDASVWEWEDDNREYLVCHASSNLALLDTLKKHRVARGEGIAGWVVESGTSTISINTQNDARFSSSVDEWTGFHTQSVLAVPLSVRGDVLGVLEILNKNQPFDDEDILLAETLAASAAIALDNARLVEKMRYQQIELHARNTELDAFAHTVAHDLKTPLNWVQGYSELLIKDWALLKDEDRIEYAKAALNGARKMENIIDDLLLLASLRQQEVTMEPIDMLSVLRQARMRLQPMIEQYGAELVSVIDYPTTIGYAPWIEGAWVNYISNAIKYGGRPPRVELGFTDLHNGFVQFWVADNGKGLTLAEQEKLFTPFSRLDRKKAHGHGLGLSIVRQIVDKLGGEIGIHSRVESGSCFFFTLPKYAVAKIQQIELASELVV